MKYRWKMEIINETDEELMFRSEGYISRQTKTQNIMKDMIRTLRYQIRKLDNPEYEE